MPPKVDIGDGLALKGPMLGETDILMRILAASSTDIDSGVRIVVRETGAPEEMSEEEEEEDRLASHLRYCSSESSRLWTLAIVSEYCCSQPSPLLYGHARTLIPHLLQASDVTPPRAIRLH